MKKIISLMLISLLIFVGCSAKPETPVSEEPTEPTQVEAPVQETQTEPEEEKEPETTQAPDGPTIPSEASKTVKFYKKIFGSNEYTLVQRMTMVIGDAESQSISTTARKGSEFATKNDFTTGETTETIRILVKDGKSFTINDADKTFWISEMSEDLNFENMMNETVNQLATLEYVTGQSDVDGVTYDTETYVNQGTTMTYFFINDELKFIENGIDDVIMRVYIDEASNQADPELFVIPDDYEESQAVG